MALSQIQIIQSLADALTWFEKELGWGVEEAELRHLTGRVGELYAAMITRGQMALETNQRGYDVVSAENERISVKTVTSSNSVKFNIATYDQVDRIIVLRLNVDVEDGVSIESLLDLPVAEARLKFRESGGTLIYTIPSPRSARPVEDLEMIRCASFNGYEIRQYENGTINVLLNGKVQTPAKPHLRTIAAEIGVPVSFESGADKNTRHLGLAIIKQLVKSN
jgi:hypothetical protein